VEDAVVLLANLASPLRNPLVVDPVDLAVNLVASAVLQEREARKDLASPVNLANPANLVVNLVESVVHLASPRREARKDLANPASLVAPVVLLA
jgi:hypothetical protein